jgi:V/A-type H+-transporting ATPase subunit C
MSLRTEKDRAIFVVDLRPVTAPYIYVNTRLRARKAKLLPPDAYPPMLRMSIVQIARYIGEHGYGNEVHALSRSYQGIDLVEAALTQNLATSFHNVLYIAPGRLGTLTGEFLNRWDIVNVMSILRGIKKGLDSEWIQSILIPAGELDQDALRSLTWERRPEEVIAKLRGWRLYPTLLEEFNRKQEEGKFARLENRLYQRYYADLLEISEKGLRGTDIFHDYIRLELDVVNIRNLFRLRKERARGKIIDQMIPGGTVPVQTMQRLAESDTQEGFTAIFRKTSLLPLLVQALHALYPNQIINERVALEYIGERWCRHERPVHELEMAVTKVHLHQMEKLSKLYPFSVIPILVFLERKKYEIFNIRAIARGIEFGIPRQTIAQYIV